MNSRGSGIPTGPRKKDVELASVRIRSSVESSCWEKAEKKSQVKIEKLSAEWSLWGRNLPEQLDFDLPLRIWAQEKVI
jgi:hypothetical protein